MRFRAGLVTGFAAGYYLGAKAGRQRYEQINQQLRKLRRSDAYQTATTKAKEAVGEGVDKAKGLVESKVGDGKGDDVPPSRFTPSG